MSACIHTCAGILLSRKCTVSSIEPHSHSRLTPPTPYTQNLAAPVERRMTQPAQGPFGVAASTSAAPPPSRVAAAGPIHGQSDPQLASSLPTSIDRTLMARGDRADLRRRATAPAIRCVRVRVRLSLSLSLSLCLHVCVCVLVAGPIHGQSDPQLASSLPTSIDRTLMARGDRAELCRRATAPAIRCVRACVRVCVYVCVCVCVCVCL